MTKTKLSALLLAGVFTVTVVPVLATAQTAAKTAWKAPRASDGHADLQGNWSNAYITPLERPANVKTRAYSKEEAAQREGNAVARFDEGNKPTDPNAPATDTTSKNCQGAGGLDCGYNSGWKDSGVLLARVNGEPRTSFIVSNDGRLPAMVAGAAARGRRFAGNEGGEGSEGDGPPAAARGGGRGAGGGAAVAAAGGGRPAGPPAGAANAGGRPGQNDNPEGRSLGERCIMSFGNSAGPIMLPLMYNNTYQFVQTKDTVAIVVEMVHDVRVIHINQPHRTDGVRPWMGDTIGHWEGDTLVTETTNFHPSQNFRGSSANLKVTESYTRVGPDRLLYHFKAEDPTTWTAPFEGEYEFMPAKGGVYEYACHEGNYGLEGILAGARHEEQDAAAATARPRAEAGSASTNR